MRWFRFYDDALNDPKVQRLPAALFRSWVNLLCLASKFGGRLPDLYDVAFALRVTEAQAERTLRDLVAANLLDLVDGVYSPHNWHGRQYASDSSAERVKRHRERKRNDDVTAPVTLHPAKSNAADTDTESDTESEKNRIKSAPVGAGELALPEPVDKTTPRQELEAFLDAERAQAVIEHRKRIRKPLTAHAAKLLAAKFAKCRDGPAAAADAMIANGWQGFEPEWLDHRGSNARPSKPTATDNQVELARAFLAGPRGGG